MPLLWLLVIVVLPSVRADAECHTACGLCAIDNNPATAACKLCRECHKVHLRMMGPNKQMLSHQQNRQLKDLEKRELKLEMKEYRWMPQNLLDRDNKLEKLDDDEGDGVKTDVEGELEAQPDQEVIPEEAKTEETESEEATTEDAISEEAKPAADCVPLSECINNDDNDDKPEKRKLRRTTNKVCPAPRNCPCIQPFKKALVKKRKLHKSAATQSTVPIMILKHIVTLDFKPDKERPTQPDWPEPDADYESRPTKPCPVKLLKKTTRKPTTTPPTPPTPCVPCMPMCPLPCGLVTQNPPFQALIPQLALEALMTLKPTTTKLHNKVTESDSSAESDEEKIEKKKIVQKKRKYDDTTKDYVYLYVGIPKDDNHARYV